MGSVLQGLAPVVQALIVIGIFMLLVLVACSRRAANNLTRFLRDLRDFGQDRTSLPSRLKRRRTSK